MCAKTIFRRKNHWAHSYYIHDYQNMTVSQSLYLLRTLSATLKFLTLLQAPYDRALCIFTHIQRYILMLRRQLWSLISRWRSFSKLTRGHYGTSEIGTQTLTTIFLFIAGIQMFYTCDFMSPLRVSCVQNGRAQYLIVEQNSAIHTYIHTYIHTHIHTCIYTHKYTYQQPTSPHTYRHTGTHTCIHIYIFINIHIPRHKYIYIYIYIPPNNTHLGHIPTCIHTCMHAYCNPA